MTAISNNNIAFAIYSVTKDKTPVEQSVILPRIVQFLNRKKLLKNAPDILSRLDKIINNGEGIISANIYSAEKLSETSKKELRQTLIYRYSAKEVMLLEQIDEKLLGGIKVEVNDEVIDLTLKNKMEKLQEYLTRKA